MDPIADFLTRVRNGIKARHRVVEVPASNVKGKYHPVTKASAIKHLSRVSRPGLRQYSGSDELPRVLNGLGIAIVSTSKGLMTDKDARTQNLGGEVLCKIY